MSIAFLEKGIVVTFSHIGSCEKGFSSFSALSFRFMEKKQQGGVTPAANLHRQLAAAAAAILKAALLEC